MPTPKTIILFAVFWFMHAAASVYFIARSVSQGLSRHYGGQPVEMGPIEQVASKILLFPLWLIDLTQLPNSEFTVLVVLALNSAIWAAIASAIVMRLWSKQRVVHHR